MSVLAIELSAHARRAYAHPQDRLVWGIGKVGVPILLKLGAELGHLGRLRTPLDPRVDRASHMDIKSEGNQWPSDGALMRRDLLPSLSKFGGRSCSIMANRKARTGGCTDTPSIAPSSLRNIAASDCASSAAKYLMKRTLWSAHAHNVSVRKKMKLQKWWLHGKKTLIILANSRQVNTLLHPGALKHV